MMELGGGLLLLLFGLIFGSLLEKKHYESIKKRERIFSNKPAITLKHYDASKPILESKLVTGSVVISIDYFKRFLSSIRNIFGGEMKSYSSLIDRGRREAILRMKEESPNADIYINMRIQTATISKGASDKSVGCVEVVAYGTALTFAS